MKAKGLKNSLVMPPTRPSGRNTTTISGDVFRATWATLYTARQVLLNKIAEVAATKANWTGIASRPGDDELLNTQGDFQAIHSWGFNGAADGWTSAGMSTVTPNVNPTP